jgi:hypothetical protein
VTLNGTPLKTYFIRNLPGGGVVVRVVHERRGEILLSAD